jgi:hypothetical protein
LHTQEWVRWRFAEYTILQPDFDNAAQQLKGQVFERRRAKTLPLVKNIAA